jgi:hypothetical protein
MLMAPVRMEATRAPLPPIVIVSLDARLPHWAASHAQARPLRRELSQGRAWHDLRGARF